MPLLSTSRLSILCRVLVIGLLWAGLAQAQVPAFDYAFAFGSVVPYTAGNTRALQSATDAAGNVYVTGNFIGTAAFGNTTLTSTNFSTDIFVAKLSPGGQWLWAVLAGGNQTDEGTGIAVDATTGNVYLTGSIFYTASFGNIALTTTGGVQNPFIAKLSPTGQWQWAINGGGTSSDFGNAITLDGNGNAYITGSLNSASATFGPVSLGANSGSQGLGLFVAKASATGLWQWATKTTDTNPSVVNAGTRIVADASGSCYVTGNFYSATLTLGNTTLTNAAPGTVTNDLFVAKLNTAGQWQWAVRAGGNSYDYANDLVLDAGGNLYVAGELQSPSVAFGTTTLGTFTTNNTAAYVAKLTPAGTWAWAAQSALSGGASASAFGKGLAVGPDGSAYLTGFFYGRPSFGSTPLVGVSQDVYVAKLTPAGRWQWALRSGGSSDEIAYDIALDPAGNAYLAGAFASPSISFGPVTITNSTSPNNNLGFVARLAAAVLSSTAANRGVAAASLWPNPARTTATLAVPAASYGREVVLTDALGRVVLNQKLPALSSRTVLDVRSLPGGVYGVRCDNTIQKLVVE